MNQTPDAALSQAQPGLKRAISLPMLIFYGIGVTIGAGIFALSGEVIAVSGNLAPWSFVVAGIIAGLTAVSYALFSGEQPRAAGEAWFVTQAFGQYVGTAVGLLLVLTAIFSSAAIAVSFSRYMSLLIPVPDTVLTLFILITITGIACKGIKETVIFAALVTCIEVGALIAVVLVGFPDVIDMPDLHQVLLPHPAEWDGAVVLTGAVVAFFAFIGFEDIVNMGEESINAERNLPIAIITTLLITLAIYVLIAIVCIAVPNRSGFLAASAPLAFVFEQATGYNPWAISLCAAIAMVNGILVQLVMSSRVLFGLARSGALPSVLGSVHPTTQTPIIAIVLLSVTIVLLAVSFSLLKLATYSSTLLLGVFCTVNLALWYQGRKNPTSRFGRWSWWGLLSFFACLLLLAWQLWQSVTPTTH